VQRKFGDGRMKYRLTIEENDIDSDASSDFTFSNKDHLIEFLLMELDAYTFKNPKLTRSN
tara:strand:+ start:1490 stop:1669 length:180 start_codon:yes stop_codon:yes gene_type:complete